jgi:lysozyme
MKKVLFVLALWFLVDWAYFNKVKPFIVSEFGIGGKKQSADSTAGTDSDSSVFTGNATGSFVYGIDISHFQGDEEDFLVKNKDSLSFIICKASEGVDKKDSAFDRNWNLARQKGFIRGAYHLYYCTGSPVQQAQFFNSTVGKLSSTDLPPIIDIEKPYVNPQCTNIQSNILLFLKEVETLTGRKPMIYINRDAGNQYLNNAQFAGYPLWVAAYTSKLTTGDIPKAWNSNWNIWQRSDSYKVNRQTNDFDMFNGNMDTLKKFISLTLLKP